MAISEKQLYWLAGLLEGEGSFMAGPPSSPRSPIVHMVSTEEDVVQKAANLTGASYRKGTRGADLLLS